MTAARNLTDADVVARELETLLDVGDDDAPPRRDRWGDVPTERPKPTIYFVRSGDLIKIGWTTKGVARRLAQLRTGAGPLELVATAPGSQRDERVLHERLALDRIPSTEWFRITPEHACALAADLGGCAHEARHDAQTERERWEAERYALLEALADAEARAEAAAVSRERLPVENVGPGTISSVLLRMAERSTHALTRHVLLAAATEARACFESHRFHTDAYAAWRRSGRR